MGQARARRRRWIAVALLLLALAGAALWIRSLLQPERLSAFLLRRASDASGLRIELGQPASVGFWPDLHLELDGLAAYAPGDSAALLRVQRVETALPWSALRSGSVQLKGLRLFAPELDLAAALRWNANREVEGPPAPLRLPQFDAPLSIAEGSVRGAGWQLVEVAVDLPSLRDATATSLTTSGALLRGGERMPFDVRVDTTPRQQGDAFELAPLRIALHEPDAETPWIELSGRAALDLPQRVEFDLDGALPTWPATWPPLPLPASADPRVALHLGYRGAMPPAGSITLSLQRGDDVVRGNASVGDLDAWLQQPVPRGLPPVLGAVEASSLQVDDTILTGVRLRIEADAEPVPAPNDAKP